MGYNIYEEQAAITTPIFKAGNNEKATALDIFHSNAGSADLHPGVPFSKACSALAGAFPALRSMTHKGLQGRAFQFFDSKGDGILDADEFVNGVAELLDPTTARSRSLVGRLQESMLGSFSNNFTSVKRVAIMGAGVAGLQTASRLSRAGFECVVFEKNSDVGGVWRENYADFGLQVPKSLYEFPEYPYPENESWELFPSGPEVQKYIQMYVKEFNLLELCRFNTQVVKLSPIPCPKLAGQERGWRVTYQPQGQGQVAEDFDFVVVATGMYGWPPHMPVARGASKFTENGGQILHSCTFTDRRAAAGKRVVVVGGGKSAVDNAVAAAKEATSSTLLYRDVHWPVPRYLLNLVPFQWGTYSRFGHAMLPTYHEESACAHWLHSVLAPVKWLWWRLVELMVCWQFALEREQRPEQPIEHDVFTGGQILNYEYRDMLKEGRVQGIKGTIDHFTEKGVVLADGRELECDMVIYGTGFSKSYDFLDSIAQERLDRQKDGVYLYRNMIPPGLPDLAFIGCEVSTFNNVLTHGLQALWLERVLTGKLWLPSSTAMARHIEKEQAWKRSWMPPSSARSSIWQLHMMRYHDNLCRDMGERHLRKGCNKLAEVFAPYTARDYAPLFA